MKFGSRHNPVALDSNRMDNKTLYDFGECECTRAAAD